MTLERKILIALALVLVAILTIGGYSALKSHDAQVQAAAQIKADEQIKAGKDQAIADRDAQLKQFQAAIASQQAQVKTSGQAVQVIEHYLPTPPGSQPLAVTAQKADLPPSVTARLPESPSYVIETQGEAVALAKGALQCDATTHALTACQQNAIDAKAKAAIDAQEIATLRAEVKGGTKMQRFKSGLKHAGCGAAAVAAGIFAGKSNQQAGAIAGGAVFAGCEVLVLR